MSNSPYLVKWPTKGRGGVVKNIQKTVHMVYEWPLWLPSKYYQDIFRLRKYSRFKIFFHISVDHSYCLFFAFVKNFSRSRSSVLSSLQFFYESHNNCTFYFCLFNNSYVYDFKPNLTIFWLCIFLHCDVFCLQGLFIYYWQQLQLPGKHKLRSNHPTLPTLQNLGNRIS